MRIRLLALLCFLLALPVLARDPAPAPPAPEKIVPIRVQLDAEGKITRAVPGNESLPAELNQGALEMARQLSFRPATINGVPTESETTVSLTIGFDKRPDGKYGLRLKHVSSGMTMQHIKPPSFPREEQVRGISGRVVAEFRLRPDGTVDLDSVKMDDVRVSRAAKGRAEANFRKAVREAMASLRFSLDTVAGRPVSLEARVPFFFCAVDGDCGGLKGPEPNKISQSPIDETVALPKLQWQDAAGEAES
jgi:TonB family protein